MAASRKSPVDLVIVGSIGLDTIETPAAREVDVLGGSASYACVAAAQFAKVGMVGVVGTDFPASARRLYRKFGIDTEGLQVEEGQTFRWSGVYEANMDNRRTLSTDLNVFANFSPYLPATYRDAPYLFLANIAPALQLHVLDQVKRPRFVLLDTMDLWINVAKDALIEVIGRVDMLTLNESEARHLTGMHGLVKAAQALLKMGPAFVCIKKGEHGSILFSKRGIYLMPAYPLETVNDPTGAGDTFAGGFLGALAKSGRVDERGIRSAMHYGSVVASFGVEDFSLGRLARLKPEDIRKRMRSFRGCRSRIRQFQIDPEHRRFFGLCAMGGQQPAHAFLHRRLRSVPGLFVDKYLVLLRIDALQQALLQEHQDVGRVVRLQILIQRNGLEVIHPEGQPGLHGRRRHLEPAAPALLHVQLDPLGNQQVFEERVADARAFVRVQRILQGIAHHRRRARGGQGRRRAHLGDGILPGELIHVQVGQGGRVQVALAGHKLLVADLEGDAVGVDPGQRAADEGAILQAGRHQGADGGVKDSTLRWNSSS